MFLVQYSSFRMNLNLIFLKLKKNYKNFESPAGRGKKYLIKRYKKNLI